MRVIMGLKSGDLNRSSNLRNQSFRYFSIATVGGEQDVRSETRLAGAIEGNPGASGSAVSLSFPDKTLEF